MVLTLEVVGPQASKLGAAARKVFSGSGGTIGRLPENDWAIPDPYISSRHARIDFRDGKYFLVDTSTNGVFVNSQDNRLVRSQPYALNNGDRIYIDAFEIRVAIAGPAPTASVSPSPLGDLFGSNAVPVTPSAPPNRDANRAIVGNPMAGSNDPFGAGDPFAPASSGSAYPRSIIPPGGVGDFDDDDADATDPLKLLGLDNKRSNADVPRAQDLARHSPMTDHYVPPTPIAPQAPPPAASPFGGSAIPDDYDPLSDGLAPRPSPPPPRAATPTNTPSPASPRPTPGGARTSATASLRPPPATAAPPPRPVAPRPTAAPPPPPLTPPVVAPPPIAQQANDRSASGATGKHLDLNSLLQGAGLSEAQITPELVENFGRILRVVVAGLMDVLRARERIKDEFRMRMTTFKAADNNPLKFSANVDDALHNLLVKRNAAYLGPVEAFEDAFNDVRNHQMAMLAGVRTAFDAMLGEFEPDRLREQFDRQVKKGSLLSGPAKLRYWELYTDKFRDMVNDRESTFRDLFGEEFARAYEEQLEKLKALNRANKK